jgi:biotin carboxylase
VRNKFLCRQALAARGIVQPAIALCKNLQEALKFADAYPPGPWLVKPVSAMGSLGVSLVRTPNEWEQAMKHLGEASTSFIVECFQPGDEFSAEGLFVYNQPHILAFTRKLTMGAPHFVEQGHAMPQELDQAIVRRVTQTIITALEALELTWGLFHVEFWLDNGYPVLGEVHVRAGGDYIHFMIEQVTGIELYGAVFDQLLAYPLDSSAWQPHRGAAIRYLTPPPGRVTAIQGWEKVVSDPQCQLAELNLQVGDVVGPVHSSSDRPGYILVYDKTAESANLAAERLCNRIQIHTYGVDKPSTDI